MAFIKGRQIVDAILVANEAEAGKTKHTLQVRQRESL